MAAVGGPGEAGVVVAKVLPDEEVGLVGEDDIVLSEALLGSVQGGDDEDAVGPEPEEGDWVVPPGDPGWGAVVGILEEVEVTDDREGREQTRREFRIFRSKCFATK